MKIFNKAIMILSILLLCCSFEVHAEDNIALSADVQKRLVDNNIRYTITVSLGNYDVSNLNILGIQIDIENTYLEYWNIISSDALIDNGGDLSNKTSYNESQGITRLLYANENSTLSKDTSNLFRIVLEEVDGCDVRPAVLPMKAYIVTDEGNITIEQDIDLALDVPPDVMSIDITYGSMQFIYDGGIWNPFIHRWANTSWTPSNDDGNLITFANNGTLKGSITVSFTPVGEIGDISGMFKYENGEVINDEIELDVDSEAKCRLNISGDVENPDTEPKKIGEISILIREVDNQ